jgi:hypothetical protein
MEQLRAVTPREPSDEPTTGDRLREHAAARVAEYAVALRAASAARQQALGDEDVRALLVQFQAALIRNLR